MKPTIEEVLNDPLNAPRAWGEDNIPFMCELAAVTTAENIAAIWTYVKHQRSLGVLPQVVYSKQLIARGCHLIHTPEISECCALIADAVAALTHLA